MERLAKLIAAIPWWHLEPDRNHELVVDGRGEFRGLDLCTVARTPDHTLAVAYLPSGTPDHPRPAGDGRPASAWSGS